MTPDTPTADALTGMRILVPRGGDWGARVAARIRLRGGRPIVAELLRIESPSDPEPLREAVRRWNAGAYDWLVATSANTAHALEGAGAAPRSASGVAVVGPATARAMSGIGFSPAVVPPVGFSARELAERLVDRLGAHPARVLFPASELAGSELEDALAAAGHRVDRVTAYRTVPGPRDAALERAIAEGSCDAILVTSGSAAAVIADRLSPLPAGTRLAAIGPPSAAALAAHGLTADIVAPSHTVDGLLDALASRPSTPPADASAPLDPGPDSAPDLPHPPAGS